MENIIKVYAVDGNAYDVDINGEFVIEKDNGIRSWFFHYHNYNKAIEAFKAKTTKDSKHHYFWNLCFGDVLLDTRSMDENYQFEQGI